MDDERDAAQLLVDSGKATVTKASDTDENGVCIEATAAGKGDTVYEVAVELDVDGRAANATCSCGTFKKFGLMKGPCRHLRATLILSRCNA